uniref:Uncharacterized protein n=1 Tax=Nelumbo nucifera TaxID=4432 RepID=A0A822Z0D8_NELNU|nr:TPA_asm: hypothetical protein HUJ06_014157 [Nelumbo nucifera]
MSIINDIPVSSRKYEMVRNLVENLIDENLWEGCESQRKVNQSVLSVAFARTLCLLEKAMSEQEREQTAENVFNQICDFRIFKSKQKNSRNTRLYGV